MYRASTPHIVHLLGLPSTFRHGLYHRSVCRSDGGSSLQSLPETVRLRTLKLVPLRICIVTNALETFRKAV